MDYYRLADQPDFPSHLKWGCHRNVPTLMGREVICSRTLYDATILDARHPARVLCYRVRPTIRQTSLSHPLHIFLGGDI